MAENEITTVWLCTPVADTDTKPSYEELEKMYKELKAEKEEMLEELIELRKFVEYVKGLKTHADFNRLRNVILTTNKKFK